MRNALLLAAIAAALPLAAQEQQQQTITCSSNGNQQFCPANTANGVRLLREQSNGVCQQGSTWSYNRRGITVNNGCSADFQVSGVNGSNNSYNNGNNGSGNNNNGNGYGNNTNNGYGNNGDRNNNGYGSNNGYGNGGRGLVIPAGTQLRVRMEQSIRPSEASQNETISGSLVNDLNVNGNVVAPAGTPVQAQINSTQGSSFDLRLTSMSVNGRTYTLASNSVHSLRDATTSDASNQSTRQQLGSVLGNIATGGEIPNGTVFNFRLTSAAQAGGRGNNGYRNGNGGYGNSPNQ